MIESAVEGEGCKKEESKSLLVRMFKGCATSCLCSNREVDCKRQLLDFVGAVRDQFSRAGRVHAICEAGDSRYNNL